MTAGARRGRSGPLPGQLEPRGPEPGRYGYAILGAGVLADGLYFALWHAPRHIARLVLLDPVPASSRFARDAAPLTGLPLALLVALYLAVPAGEGDAGSLLAVYLVLISALTLPHAVWVSYMDAR